MADDGGSVPSVGDSVLVSLCANACASPVRLYSEVAASQEVSRKKTRCDGGVAANQRFSRIMTLRMVGLAPAARGGTLRDRSWSSSSGSESAIVWAKQSLSRATHGVPSGATFLP